MKEILHVDICNAACLRNMLEPHLEEIQAHHDDEVGDFLWPGISPFFRTLNCQSLTKARGEHQGGWS